MTINDYLKHTRTLRTTNSTPNISDTLSKQFDNVLKQAGLKNTFLIIIDSYESQCSTVCIGENKYIIWDLSYWNYIENYLIAANCNCDNKEQLSYNLYNFLVYKLLESRQKNATAKEALKKIYSDTFKDIFSSNPEDLHKVYDVSQTLDFFKLFVYLHEVNHLQLKENSLLKSIALDEIQNYLYLISENPEKWFTSYSDQGTLTDIENISIKNSIEQYKKDDKIKTEIICDIYSLKSLFASIEYINKNDLVIDDQFIVDFLCLKDAVVGYFNDVLYLEHFIKKLVSYNAHISETFFHEASRGLYDKANLYLSRETLFMPFIMAQLLLLSGKFLNIRNSRFYDIYNTLNHTSMINHNMLKFKNYYNDLLKIKTERAN